MILTAPHIAARDCDFCRKWRHNESTGKAVKAGGQLCPRTVADPPPCRDPRHESGCPKGDYENQKSLTWQNVQAYRHYRECKAVGRFPDDPIVRRNAGIICAVEDAVEHERQDRLFVLLSLPKVH